MAKYLDSNGLTYFYSQLKAKFLENVSWDSTNKKLTKTKNGTTDDLVTFATVATSGSYTDLSNKPTIPTVPSAYTSNPAMDGTASAGSSTSWSRGDHVHPTDTSRAAASHSHGNITSGGDITATAPTIASGDKLIINDESESKITNGPSFGTSTTTYLRNDGTWGTPAGTATDTKVTQTVDTSTTGTSAYPILLKNTTATATITDTARFDAAVKVVPATGEIQATTFNGVRIINASTLTIAGTNGAIEVNDDYQLGAACGYGVNTSITAGSTSQLLPTTEAVVNYVATATTGSLQYKGTATSNSDLTTSYKKGWYWIVGSAGGTIAGQTVEAGDMVLAHADYSGTIANDVDIVQSNIDTMTNTDIDTAMAAA